MKSLLVVLCLVGLAVGNTVIYGYNVSFNDSLTISCTATNITSIKYVLYGQTSQNSTIQLRGLSINNQAISKDDLCTSDNCTYSYNVYTIEYCLILVLATGNNKISYIIDQEIQSMPPIKAPAEDSGVVMTITVVSILLMTGVFGFVTYILCIKYKAIRAANAPRTNPVSNNPVL